MMPLTQRKQAKVISIILDSDDELDENSASSESSTSQTQCSSTAKEQNTRQVENHEPIDIDIDNDADIIETAPTSTATNYEDDIMFIESDDAQSIKETNEDVAVQAVTSSTPIKKGDKHAPSTSSASNNYDNDIVLIEVDKEVISSENVAKQTASSSTQTKEDRNKPNTSSASNNNDNDLVLVEFDEEEISNENVAVSSSTPTKEDATTSTHKKTQSSSPVTVDLDEIDRDKPGTSGISSSVLNNKETEDVITQIIQNIPEQVLDTQNTENNSNGDGDDDIMIVEDDDVAIIPEDSITSIIEQEYNNINIQCKVTTYDRSTNTDTLGGSGIFENLKYDPEDDLIFIKPIVEEIRYKSVDGNMYICLVCKRLFDNIALMMTHLKIHDEKSRLCYRCGLIFNSFPDTLKHMKQCIPEKKFNTPLRRCSICKFRAISHGTMRDHLYYVHGNKRFICNICNISFYNPDHLRTHVQFEHRNYYKCNICNIEIMFPNFDSHMRIHLLDTINENTPKCAFCNVQLPFSDNDVKKHFETRNHNYNETMWKVRNKISEFTCLCCFTPVTFNKFYDYSLHLKTHGYYKMNMNEVISACLSLQKTNRLPFPMRYFKNSSKRTHSTPSSRKKRVIRDGKLPWQVKSESLIADDLAANCSQAKTIKTEDSMLSSEYEIKTEYSSYADRSTSRSGSHTFIDDIKTEYTDDNDDVYIVNNDDDCNLSNIKLEV